MNTCLQNCKPGDIIKTLYHHTYIVIEPINEFNILEVRLEDGTFVFPFDLGDIRIITKIIKIK